MDAAAHRGPDERTTKDIERVVRAHEDASETQGHAEPQALCPAQRLTS
jgi:hypothetical protein